MPPPSLLRCARPGLIGGWLLLPLLGLAQSIPAAPPQDWREANDGVAQMRRGHADIVRWEQTHVPAAAPVQPPAPAFALPDADTAVRQAWAAHSELGAPLARLGERQAELIASGRWLELDPGLNWRLADFPELLEVAAQARKAWIDAVASRQALVPLHQALDAAEAASELGRRMVGVGNWSRLQQVPHQLAQVTARAALRRAEYAAAQARQRLLKTLRLSGVEPAVALPDRLPDWPADAMTATEFDRRLAAIQAELPRAERMRQQGSAPLVFEAYQASHALARSARDEVLALRGFSADEALLHYNGMLKSSWELLAEVRNQAQVAADAIGAQKDFELARIDLEWLLLGGEPAIPAALNGGTSSAPAAAGH